MNIPRGLLAQAFPDNPRLRTQLEAVLNLVDSINSQATELQSRLDVIATEINAGSFQPLSALLSAISTLPNKLGAIEVTGDGETTIRGIDADDPASLLSRGTAYTVLVGIAGKGTTAQRPTIPTNAVAIYFDTTLGGKPIFWNGAGWVDATGTAV